MFFLFDKNNSAMFQNMGMGGFVWLFFLKQKK